MKTFDPTKPVQTRDGRKARIVATMDRAVYPILAVLAGEDGEYCETFTALGRAYGSEESSSDLVNLPEAHVAIADWFAKREQSHLLDAMQAFVIANLKISGVKFIRTITPEEVTGSKPGLTEAKLAYETMESRNMATWRRTRSQFNNW